MTRKKMETFERLSMIVYTSSGWVIERERRAEEFLHEWNRWIENNITPISIGYLKEWERAQSYKEMKQ